MLLANIRHNRLVLQCIDALLAVAALIVSYVLRSEVLVSFTSLPDIEELSNYFKFLLGLGIVAPIVLYVLKFYSMGMSQRPAHILNLAAQASIILFLLMIVAQFLLRAQMSRLAFIMFVPLAIGFFFARTQATRWFIAQTLRAASGSEIWLS
jgi:hypothetical protein